MSKDVAAIRDQLGRDPDTFQVLVANYRETIAIEEGPSIVETDNIGTSMIWGHPTSGIWGTSKWGSHGRYTTRVRVVSPNKIFHEHFRDNDFEGSVSPGTWDPTNYQLELGVGTAMTKAVFLDTDVTNPSTVSKATLRVTGTSLTDMTYAMSNVGTAMGDWESVTDQIEHAFSSVGTALYVRFVNSAGTAYVTDFDVEYL